MLTDVKKIIQSLAPECFGGGVGGQKWSAIKLK